MCQKKTKKLLPKFYGRDYPDITIWILILVIKIKKEKNTFVD